MGIKLNEALDNSLNSVIIPQLDGLDEYSLNAIRSFASNSLRLYFEEVNKTTERINADEAFQKVLEYLGMPTEKKFTQEEMDSEFWKSFESTLNDRYSDKRNNLDASLPITEQSINVLSNNAII